MAVTPNKHQRNRPSRAGQLVGFCSAYIPAAHQAQGRAHGRLAGSVMVSSSRLTRPRELGRPFGVGSFGAEGHGANRVLAKPYHCPLSAERLKNFAKGSERHFHGPFVYAPSRSEGGLVSVREFVGEIQHD